MSYADELMSLIYRSRLQVPVMTYVGLQDIRGRNDQLVTASTARPRSGKDCGICQANVRFPDGESRSSGNFTRVTCRASMTFRPESAKPTCDVRVFTVPVPQVPKSISALGLGDQPHGRHRASEQQDHAKNQKREALLLMVIVPAPRRHDQSNSTLVMNEYYRNAVLHVTTPPSSSPHQPRDLLGQRRDGDVR